MVKIAESDEGSDCFDTGRRGPFSNGFKFGGVHFDVPRGDSKAKVFDIL